MPIQAMQLISQFTCLYGARLRNKRYQFVSGGPAGKYKPPKKVFRDRNSKGKGEVPTLSIFVRASWPGHLPSHRSFPPAVVIFPPRLGGRPRPDHYSSPHLPSYLASTWGHSRSSKRLELPCFASSSTLACKAEKAFGAVWSSKWVIISQVNEEYLLKFLVLFWQGSALSHIRTHIDRS